MEKLADIDYDEIVHETEKAILFRFGEEEIWIPKSIADVDKQDRVVTIPHRFAFDNGLV
jgi:hypothetical protein